jgi:hypothetical protein
LLIPPPEAVTVRVKAPVAVVDPADSVKVRLPLPGAAMVEEEKPAVTPLGTPLIDRVTAELNPVPAVVVTVIGTDPPRDTLALLAPTDSVKAPVTVRLSV